MGATAVTQPPAAEPRDTLHQVSAPKHRLLLQPEVRLPAQEQKYPTGEAAAAAALDFVSLFGPVLFDLFLFCEHFLKLFVKPTQLFANDGSYDGPAPVGESPPPPRGTASGLPPPWTGPLLHGPLAVRAARGSGRALQHRRPGQPRPVLLRQLGAGHGAEVPAGPPRESSMPPTSPSWIHPLA
ncbi:hypothetical protein NDU88_003458 [Pleurodeles waltl]|uniref:Uncharacterized protein n=1 Tax=Pleurodeles waltl TaxID=8319 RepID=A0AAV7SG00_PLEWA|nr:hypothetical protein NDU88_003458 [Pleurodeles waltl]